MSDNARQAWVERVLGVGFTQSLARTPLLPIWVAAKDDVDTQLNKLRTVLESYSDPDLRRIADYGLYGVTEKTMVSLMAALRDVDAAAENDAVRAKLANAVTSTRKVLDESRGVQLIDNNPFGVAMSLQRRLGEALSEIERHISA